MLARSFGGNCGGSRSTNASAGRAITYYLLMVLRAQVMHSVNACAEMIGIDVRRNAMAQVEYMTRSVSVARKHLRDAIPDVLR